MDGFREDGADAVPEAIEVSHADVLRKLIVTAEEIHQYIQVKLGGEWWLPVIGTLDQGIPHLSTPLLAW